MPSNELRRIDHRRELPGSHGAREACMQLLDQAEPGCGALLPASADNGIDACTTLGIEVEALLAGAFFERHRAGAR